MCSTCWAQKECPNGNALRKRWRSSNRRATENRGSCTDRLGQRSTDSGAIDQSVASGGTSDSAGRGIPTQTGVAPVLHGTTALALPPSVHRHVPKNHTGTTEARNGTTVSLSWTDLPSWSLLVAFNTRTPRYEYSGFSRTSIQRVVKMSPARHEFIRVVVYT